MASKDSGEDKIVIVTDKEYYLDNNLKDLLDLCIQRREKKWDNLLVIDGKERSGKTTLGKAICYYYAHTMGVKFGLDNVFFNVESLEKFAKTSRNSVIMWDEAAFGGLAMQWQNKMQVKLNMLLMAAGKYGHFYVFIIPSFFRLNRYLAIDRSLGLLHVYTEDLVNRGLFTCYNEAQKTWIYNSYRKSETYGKTKSFVGRFVVKNVENNIYNEDKYEEKKDRAIDNIRKLVDSKKEEDIRKLKDELKALQYKIASELPMNDAIRVTNKDQSTIYRWKREGVGI